MMEKDARRAGYEVRPPIERVNAQDLIDMARARAADPLFGKATNAAQRRADAALMRELAAMLEGGIPRNEGAVLASFSILCGPGPIIFENRPQTVCRASRFVVLENPEHFRIDSLSAGNQPILVAAVNAPDGLPASAFPYLRETDADELAPWRNLELLTVSPGMGWTLRARNVSDGMQRFEAVLFGITAEQNERVGRAEHMAAGR
jgi:hypothetical protein